jgi:hypothetical protein
LINRDTFGGVLQAPVLHVHQGREKLGYWDRRHGVISLSAHLLKTEAWCRVIAVLKHEMLHQFIEEQMGMTDVPPHGELFQTLQRQFSIELFEDVGLKQEGEIDHQGQRERDERSQVLDKVQKLLSLAQSQEIHEAEAAMSKANALMLKWNLDQRELHQRRQHEIRHLGKPGKVFLHLKMLACLLRDFFFVDVIWVHSMDVERCKSGRVLEIIGRPENVALAEYVYHFMLNVGEQHWKRHRKDVGVGSRMNYIYGLIAGFHEKCKAEREKSEQDQALVWTGEAWLEEVMRRRHPRTRSMSKSKAQVDRGSFDAGKQQGKKLVLRKGVEHKSQRSALGKGQTWLIDKS